MRINVYAEELTNDIEIVRKSPANVPGETFCGVRMFLKSPDELHDDPNDDDRSAITLWVPWTKAGGHRPQEVMRLLRSMADALDDEFRSDTERPQITVTREGRPEIFIPKPESLKRWILARCPEEIHCFIPAAIALVGADWAREAVLTEIDNAVRLGLLFGEAKKGNMGHALAVVSLDSDGNEALRLFDIGELTEDDLAYAPHLFDAPPAGGDLYPSDAA